MRSFLQIIADAGGPGALARALDVDAGVVKQWKRSESIPAWYWRRMVARELATLDELSVAAERRSGLAAA